MYISPVLYSLFTIGLNLLHGVTSDKYISVMRNKTNRHDAENACKRCGGTLLQWNNGMGEIGRLFNQTGREIESFWIGDYNNSDSETSFQGCANKVPAADNIYTIKDNSKDLCEVICGGYTYFAIKRMSSHLWIGAHGCLIEEFAMTDKMNISNTTGDRKDRTCACFNHEYFKEHCDSKMDETNSKLCKDEFRVYSIGVVVRCTFDDCRCNGSIEYDNLWNKSSTCFGNAGLADNKISHDTKHTTCLLMHFHLKPSSDTGVITIHLPGTNSNFTYCLSFVYYMNGISINNLAVNITDSENKNGNRQSWKIEGNQGNIWRKAHISFTRKGPFKILISGTVGSNILNAFENNLAIDNITVSAGTCKQTHRDIDCSFETDMCGWMQPSTNKLRWFRNTGSTQTANTGPSMDRRSSDGSYLYMEANSGAKSDKAELFSPVICTEQPHNYCLRFWYHMKGISINYLRIYVNTMNNDIYVWERVHQQGSEWKEGFLNIQSTEMFSIKFEAKKNGGKSDIAIDDITLVKGTCENGILLECDFEDASYLCGLMVSGNHTWERRELTENMVLSIVFENQLDLGLVSKVSTAFFPEQGNRWFCLQFWFESTNFVGFYVTINRIGRESNVSEIVWSNEKLESPNIIAISFFSISPFQVIFAAIHLNSSGELVAIDDIALINERCNKGSADDISLICPVILFGKEQYIFNMDKCDKSDVHSALCERKDFPGSTEITENCRYEHVIATTTNNTELPKESTSTMQSTVDSSQNSTPGNASKLQSLADTNETIVGFQIATGVLVVLVVGLIVAMLVVVLKHKRSRPSQQKHAPEPDINMSLSNMSYDNHQGSFSGSHPEDPTQKRNIKDKVKNKSVTTNRGDYEITSVVFADKVGEKMAEKGKVNIEQEKGNRGSYELASAISVNDVIKSKNTHLENKDYNSHVYQNTVDAQDKDYVYTDNEAGEYDHIGNTEKRRIIGEKSKDPTYDHAVGVDNALHGDYDTTTYKKDDSGTNDSGYFVLEKEFNRSSNPYDHMS